MLSTCQEPYDTMVLLVCHAIPHFHEDHLVGLPRGAHYALYMLLLAGKHMIMPFSFTNNNIHVGRMLRHRIYGEHIVSHVCKTFNNFMTANMHQKFCPIQALPAQHIANSIFRQLTFTNKYNITKPAV